MDISKKSIMEQIALLPTEEQEIVLAGLDMETLQWDWSMWSRPNQVPPKDESWDVGLFLGGRGVGKTRAAAEFIKDKARDTSQGPLRFLLVARTAADVREVIVEGESGILAVSPPSERPDYRPSIRRLIWPNGNQAFCTSADEPDSLRGVQAHYSWGDEIAAWRQPTTEGELSAWDNLRIATRLGRNPQIFATTTPKRVQILFDLLEEQKKNDRIWVSRGSTFENAGNLSQAYLDAITGVYDGTSLARQELYGEMLDAVEGAMWDDEILKDTRVTEFPRLTPLRVIGVDPSVAENPGDYCGIVVCASTAESDLYKRRAWVLEDASLKGSPTVWAREVVRMANRWGCPVVAEVNQGGALVRNAIHQIDPSVVVLEVHSKVGKKLRAEPITLAYQQKRVHHVGRHVDLETQMVTWDPEHSKKSPDRVDALVHALTALLISPPKGFSGSKVRATSFAGRRINTKQKPSFRVNPSSFRIR